MQPSTMMLRILVWALLCSYPALAKGLGESCPGVCVCKWKGGKRTVECIDRALITIPENVDPETQVLDMSGNNLQILPRETFKRVGLLNLQRVYLRNCHIGQIDDQALRGLTNLIELDLSQNLLTGIPSGTFQDVPFLRDLILAHNPIQKVDSNAFQTLLGLVKLDLSHCEIQVISAKAFVGDELLESLKLNGNRLTELRPKTLESLSRLRGVELHDNPWMCDCRLRATKEWLLKNNIPYPIAPICSSGPERVLGKTFAELHIDDFACKPEILPVNRYVEATTGDNATIVCRAGAVPSAHINWYWNGRLLVNNSAFSSYQKIHIYEEGHFEKRSSLVLTNAQETDSSEFYCVAENRAGNAEANFTLHVSLRTAGMATLGSGQIAGLSAALVILILFILLIILVLLVRLRRMPFSESKTPGQLEVVTVVNGSAVTNGKGSITPISHNEPPAFPERKPPAELSFSCNPVQKPPRVAESSYPAPPASFAAASNPAGAGPCYLSPSSGPGNNPDLINDTKRQGSGDIPTSAEDAAFATDRPVSGEYSRNGCDSLYPSGLWDQAQGSESDSYLRRAASSSLPAYGYDDKTPIIGDGVSTGGSEEDVDFSRTVPRTNQSINGYPPDYGLPIVESSTESSPGSHALTAPTNAKTLRVWQRGGVPVLPPVTALKRVLTSSRNSPDEGYQEGCGTDV